MHEAAPVVGLRSEAELLEIVVLRKRIASKVGGVFVAEADMVLLEDADHACLRAKEVPLGELADEFLEIVLYEIVIRLTALLMELEGGLDNPSFSHVFDEQRAGLLVSMPVHRGVTRVARLIIEVDFVAREVRASDLVDLLAAACGVAVEVVVAFEIDGSLQHRLGYQGLRSRTVGQVLDL